MKRTRLEQKKWHRSTEYNGALVVHTSTCGRLALRSYSWRERTTPAFLNRKRHVTRNGWNVYVDGKLVLDRVLLLRDAKSFADEAIGRPEVTS